VADFAVELTLLILDAVWEYAVTVIARAVGNAAPDMVRVMVAGQGSNAPPDHEHDAGEIAALPELTTPHTSGHLEEA
jgi:hypothetical protein